MDNQEGQRSEVSRMDRGTDALSKKPNLMFNKYFIRFY